MASFLSDAERARLSSFPDDVPHQDLVAYFRLLPDDQAQIPKTAAPQNRLGFALQLGALRYLGFCPKDVAAAPPAVVLFVAEQLGVSPEALQAYAGRSQTRSDHVLLAQRHLGFRKMGATDLRTLRTWLVERALEHDRPGLLLETLCERLRAMSIIRPNLFTLGRLVSEARREARRTTFRLVSPLLTDGRRVMLDSLLVTDNSTGRAPLVWLRQEASSCKARSILETVEKLRHLRVLGAVDIDLEMLNPNLRKSLARLGRASTPQALSRMHPERRYPILLSFLEHTRQEVVDELVEQVDRCLGDTYARARRQLDEAMLAGAQQTSPLMRLLRDLCRLATDPAIADAELRRTIYERCAPPDELAATAERCEQLIQPEEAGQLEFLAAHYGYLRQFTPAVLEALRVRSNRDGDPLIAAIELLRRMNLDGARKLPADAPTGFVPERWRPHVRGADGQLDRCYYELCALWQLRDALRAGDVWLEQSRRYADPETYLIPKAHWAELRTAICEQTGAPPDGEVRLEQRRGELEGLLERFDKRAPEGEDVCIADGRLVVRRLTAEDLPPSVARLEQLVAERLPLVELPDLMLEVDGWTRFSDVLEHAGHGEPRSKDVLVNCHAAILAHACNFGLTRMARIADLSYSSLAWCSTWYLREETLTAANIKLVNAHFRQPLTRLWGGGTLSSSDGQRFPVPVQARNATAIPRYFGFGRGLTFYSWTSDQFSQYGCKPVPATTRDATYVLDAILGNETELPIAEHTTDTAGYTDLVFALFDLLGLQFSPRLRDLADQRLFRLGKGTQYQHLDPLLRGTIRRDLIIKHWDDLLRVAGSMKRGYVTASLFIGKLQSYRRQNTLTRALQEYGRLAKTIFILRYIEDEAFRRRIGAQLNKGEALHALRNFLFLANLGQIRSRTLEDQANQALCLTVVTNAVILWNTVYMARVLEQLRAEGHEVSDDDVAHLSPARFEHINPFGRYHFDIALARARAPARPLRQPLTASLSRR